MKRTIKIITVASMCFAALLALLGCNYSASAADNTELVDVNIPRQNIGPTSKQIVEDIKNALSPSLEFEPVDDDYISRMNFGSDHELLIANIADAYIVRSADAETNADMIGVIRASSESQAKMILPVIKRFIEAQKLRLMNAYQGYAPSEIPKIQNANVEEENGYILFTILTERHKEIAEDIFEGMVDD